MLLLLLWNVTITRLLLRKVVTTSCTVFIDWLLLIRYNICCYFSHPCKCMRRREGKILRDTRKRKKNDLLALPTSRSNRARESTRRSEADFKTRDILRENTVRCVTKCYKINLYDLKSTFSLSLSLKLYSHFM